MGMNVAGYDMVSWIGDMGSYSDTIEDLSRPGLDGHLFRKMGKRGVDFSVKTKSTEPTEYLANKRRKEMENLAGTYVKLEDGNGNQLSQVMVMSARGFVRAMGASTNGDSYLIDMDWIFRRTKTE